MGAVPEPGAMFGRYRIVRRIGDGADGGLLFVAEQTGLGREVALKLLPPELASDAEYRARFVREAGGLAALDSPHVVRVYDAGEHDGWLYHVTQLVSGGSLAERMATDGPMPVPIAVAVTRQVAEGLAAAHAAGIVHRDIRPDNVFVRPGRDGWHAYLGDLGATRDLDAESTRTSARAGSYDYVAPEVVDGSPATTSSDIYSMGCLLWAALTGRAPYSGSIVEVGTAHAEAPIPQGPERTPADAALNTVLRGAMAKDPADRYRTVEDLMADLDRVATGGSAGPGGPVDPFDAPTGVGMAPVLPAAMSGSGAQHTAVVGAGHVAPPGYAGAAAYGVSAPASSPDSNRTWLMVAGGILALALVIGGLAGVLALTGGDDEPQAGPDGPSPSGSTDASASASASTSSSPSPSYTPPPDVTCWDGSRQPESLCSEPAGMKGIGYVFIGLQRQVDKGRCVEREYAVNGQVQRVQGAIGCDSSDGFTPSRLGIDSTCTIDSAIFYGPGRTFPDGLGSAKLWARQEGTIVDRIPLRAGGRKVGATIVVDLGGEFASPYMLYSGYSGYGFAARTCAQSLTEARAIARTLKVRPRSEMVVKSR